MTDHQTALNMARHLVTMHSDPITVRRMVMREFGECPQVNVITRMLAKYIARTSLRGVRGEAPTRRAGDGSRDSQKLNERDLMLGSKALHRAIMREHTYLMRQLMLSHERKRVAGLAAGYVVQNAG